MGRPGHEIGVFMIPMRIPALQQSFTQMKEREGGGEVGVGENELMCWTLENDTRHQVALYPKSEN